MEFGKTDGLPFLLWRNWRHRAHYKNALWSSKYTLQWQTQGAQFI